jgi:hypothetical protein
MEILKPYLGLRITEIIIFIHIILHMEKDMKRKLRMISGSLVVTIPSQIAELYNMVAGDIVTIEQGGPGELRLKKATS